MIPHSLDTPAWEGGKAMTVKEMGADEREARRPFLSA